MPGKPCQQFKTGDLVFAKMRGYPHWPARVCKSDESHKKRVPVFFFGTHQIGQIAPEHMVPFAGNKLKYGNSTRLKGFSEGMWEIQNSPGVGKRSKFAAKSTPSKGTPTSKATSSAEGSSERVAGVPEIAAAAENPAKPIPSATKGRGAKLKTDADDIPVKLSPDAAASIASSCAGSTLRLKRCVVKCFPAKTPVGDFVSARLPESAPTALDRQTKSVQATEIQRTPSEQFSAQTLTENVQTEIQSPPSQTATSAPPRRRGRPSRAEMVEKKPVVPQAAQSGANAALRSLRLKSCVVKCVSAKTPELPSADELVAPPKAPAPQVAPPVKRKPGRPSKKAIQMTGEVKNTPPGPCAEPAGPKPVDREAPPASTQIPSVSKPNQEASGPSRGSPRKPGGAKKAGPEGKTEVPPSEGGNGKRKRKGEQSGKSVQEGKAQVILEEESTFARARKRPRKHGGKAEAQERGGARRGKITVPEEPSAPVRGEKMEMKEGEKEEGARGGGGGESQTAATPDRSTGGRTKTTEDEKGETQEVRVEAARIEGKTEKTPGPEEETAPGQRKAERAPEPKEDTTPSQGKTEKTPAPGEETVPGQGKTEKTAGPEEETAPGQRKTERAPEPEEDATPSQGKTEKSAGPGEEMPPVQGKMALVEKEAKAEESAAPVREGKLKRKEERETPREGAAAAKTKGTADKSAPREKRRRKQGQVEESQQEAKTKARTEESTSPEIRLTKGEEEKTQRAGGEMPKKEVSAEEEEVKATATRGGKNKKRLAEKELQHAEGDTAKTTTAKTTTAKTTTAKTTTAKTSTAKTTTAKTTTAKTTTAKTTTAKTTTDTATPVTAESALPQERGEKRQRTEEKKQPGGHGKDTEETEAKSKSKEEKEEIKPERGQKERKTEEATLAQGEKKQKKEETKQQECAPEKKGPKAKEAGKRPTGNRQMKTTKGEARGEVAAAESRTGERKDGGNQTRQKTSSGNERDLRRLPRETKDVPRPKEGGDAEEQQQRRLAVKRDRVLKSLRGLIKSSKGGKRRDAGARGATKSGARPKPKGAKAQLPLKESTARKKGAEILPPQKEPEKEREKEKEKEKDMPVPAGEAKVQESAEKDGRKLIGKIVKATAKVHVKTMMGGTSRPPTQEGDEKKRAAADGSAPEERKTERVLTDDEKAATKRRDETRKDRDAAGKKAEKKDDGAAQRQNAEKGRGGPAAATDEDKNHQQKNHRLDQTATDSTLHRIHGDIRISLKSDNPDFAKCLAALDQLSGVYVTSQHVERHSELVSTLRKMRFYRANQDIMDKAAMLYNRFKNTFLLDEGEEVVSAAFLRSLLQEKEREETERRKKSRAPSVNGTDSCPRTSTESST
ncbi:uncharacterized protein psip1b isoform X2 [Stigmatopora argus]